MKKSFGFILLYYFSCIAVVTISETEVEINTKNNLTLMEGDIKLLPWQQAELERNSISDRNVFGGPQSLVRNHSYFLWPNGVVPYALDNSASSDSSTVNAIDEAMQEYENLTCIRFVQRTNQADYINFVKGIGCWSLVGRIRGQQNVSIGKGCESKGIVMHEIFHALGRWHEQSRPDRDKHITIHSENIQPGFENQFEKIHLSPIVSLQGVPYDHLSIMHYGAYTLSRNNKPTITSKDPGIPLSALGQRTHFTERDLQHVRLLYNCPNASRGGSWSSWSGWTQCSMTCNTGSQSRSRTCVGGNDCTGSNIETRNCNTQNCTIPAVWSTWNAWSGCSATCGGGRQARTRTCQNGHGCVGPSTEIRDCSTQNCSQPSTWSEWSGWGECSSTCQGGMRSRIRRCVNGNSCTGANIEYQKCNTDISCTPDPSSDPWGEWSSCSASCGTGSRSRSRNCGLSECQTQTQDCNTQECPDPLKNLRHLGCFGVPTVTSLKLLEGLTPELSDSATTRKNPVEKCGKAALQFHYTKFAVGLGFCISGSNRSSDYTHSAGFFCKDGKGGIFDGSVYMDVYEIPSPQAYFDALQVSSSSTVLSSAATQKPINRETPDNYPSSSFIVLPSLLSLFAAVFAFLLF